MQQMVSERGSQTAPAEATLPAGEGVVDFCVCGRSHDGKACGAMSHSRWSSQWSWRNTDRKGHSQCVAPLSSLFPLRHPSFFVFTSLPPSSPSSPPSLHPPLSLSLFVHPSIPTYLHPAHLVISLILPLSSPAPLSISLPLSHCLPVSLILCLHLGISTPHMAQF